MPAASKRGYPSTFAAAAAPLLLSALAAQAQVFSVAPGGPSGLQSNRLYTAPGGIPGIVGGGNGMGIPSPADVIDGASFNAEGPLDLHFEWTWWFSVDSGSLGLPPEVLPGYNVANQAAARQQAGDIFMATEGFDPDTGILPVPPSIGLNNNALVINQSAQYPHFFGLQPVVSPFLAAQPGSEQDDLNAAARGEAPAPGQFFYFSLSQDSPSLPNVVPGIIPSGANIFVDVNVNVPGTENVYAVFFQLGLLPSDDITSLVVFDENENGHYDQPDAVYFTLARGSPSLAGLGGSAANILVSRNGAVALAVEHTFLGLAFGDAIDGLDVVEIIGDSVLATIEAEFSPANPCPPDLSGHASATLPGLGTPDGVLNNEDFFCYLIFFTQGNIRADLTTGAIPGQPGFGVPNGTINNEDFFYYLGLFAAGC